MQETEDVRMHVVVVTGMSGSGKSVVMDVLEDIGYYCIDNLPPQLMGKFVDICRESENHLQKLAIAADLRSGDMFTDAYRTLLDMERQPDLDVKILYIEAEDEVIIKRYKENAASIRWMSVSWLPAQCDRLRTGAAALQRARITMWRLYFSASQLKEQIREIFLDNSSDSMSIKVTSFGFKYGVSTESDLVFDVRCLPNPYYIPELRHHTGCEKCVQDYVMSFEQSQTLMKKLKDLLDFLIPLYIQEGKSRLVIAFGCTGGKHRSITFTELIGDYLISKGMHVVKQHRDIGKDRS
ncbi:MAG: RNase adapter RapZ [Ruminococcus sp.]